MPETIATRFHNAMKLTQHDQEARDLILEEFKKNLIRCDSPDILCQLSYFNDGSVSIFADTPTHVEFFECGVLDIFEVLNQWRILYPEARKSVENYMIAMTKKVVAHFDAA